MTVTLTLDIEYGDVRLPARFWEKVYPEPMSGCWLWGSPPDSQGYGQIQDWIRRSTVRAHVALARATGADLLGKDVCHTCDVKLCCNPDHLYVGTRSQNIQDALRRGLLNNSREHITTCPDGHEYDHLDSEGYRACSTCRALTARKLKSKRRLDITCSTCYYVNCRCT